MIARYEELRRLVVDRRGAQAHGLALFINRGMVSWLQAWSHCIGAQIAPAVPPSTAPGPEHEICPVRLHNDVAMLLASMVLVARQEVLA